MADRLIDFITSADFPAVPVFDLNVSGRLRTSSVVDVTFALEAVRARSTMSGTSPGVSAASQIPLVSVPTGALRILVGSGSGSLDAWPSLVKPVRVVLEEDL